MLTDRINAILDKLEAARRIPDAVSWLGVEKHQFRLRPPLPEAALTAFEQRQGIQLPEDYRAFLLLAGDGGAGPYYGIEPLSEWANTFEEEAEQPGFLASPCPLTDGAAVRQAWRAAVQRSERRRRGELQPGAPPTDPWGGILPCRWSEWGRGTLHLCDQGCTYSSRLIVAGEARGRIVNLDEQLWNPPYFARDASFLDWYERWLDQVLSGTEPHWFGFDNPDYAA